MFELNSYKMMKYENKRKCYSDFILKYNFFKSPNRNIYST